MIEITNTEVWGIETALRGMRNPKNSWNKSDSGIVAIDDKYADISWEHFKIGENDMKLAMALCKAGQEHRKFLRMINVSCDMIIPTYMAAELDTYKINTVRNSCSLQHKGSSRDFTMEDFSWDGESEEENEFFQSVIEIVNIFRDKYIETKDYKYFRMMRQIMPMGYNYKFTWAANYEVLANIYRQRKNHSLVEWREFCAWIESLPYSELITGCFRE